MDGGAGGSETDTRKGWVVMERTGEKLVEWGGGVLGVGRR